MFLLDHNAGSAGRSRPSEAEARYAYVIVVVANPWPQDP
jgi:hypothetical protein